MGGGVIWCMGHGAWDIRLGSSWLPTSHAQQGSMIEKQFRFCNIHDVDQKEAGNKENMKQAIN